MPTRAQHPHISVLPSRVLHRFASLLCLPCIILDALFPPALARSDPSLSWIFARASRAFLPVPVSTDGSDQVTSGGILHAVAVDLAWWPVLAVDAH
eukprot:8616932-Alexandrium_andersonii.AAC.1